MAGARAAAASSTTAAAAGSGSGASSGGAGACGGSEATAGGDYRIGTIVWVRRRNGSWWPGKVVSLNELSANHLMSPRSGTPVKLLGREDASVDWYNMEKSKRVKAFRCGEFDDCISKAQSVSGAPSKKREKYARREDAIRHALQLERQQHEFKSGPHTETADGNQETQCTVFKKPQNRRPVNYKERKFPAADNKNMLDATTALDVKPQLDIKPSLMNQQTFQQLDSRHSVAQKARQPKDPNNRDDGNEGTPRMRGLQDFGLKTAPSKKKSNSTVTYENGEMAVTPGNCNSTATPVSHLIINGLPANCNRGCSLSIKRKRTNVGAGPNEECSVRKRERRRPLTQVLQSSAKLPVSSASKFGSISYSTTEHCLKERGMGMIMPSNQFKSSSSDISVDILNFCNTYKEDSLARISKDITVKTEKSLNDLPCVGNNSTPTCVVPGNLNSDFRRGQGTTCGVEAIIPDLAPIFPVERNYVRDVAEQIENNVLECVRLNTDLEDADVCSNYSTPDSAEPSAENVTDAGASKWQSKGRRNARNLMKKASESENNANDMNDTCATFTNAVLPEEKLNVNKELKSKKFNGGTSELEVENLPEGDTNEKAYLNYGADSTRQRENLLTSIKRETHNVENQELMESHCIMGGGNQRFFTENFSLPLWKVDEDANDWFWDKTTNGCHSGMYQGMSSKMLKSLDEMHFKQPEFLGPKPYKSSGQSTVSTLFDVDIDVHASYQGERVPLVSLMSKVNNKAVVGHPVTVETFEDGLSDILLENGCLDDSLVDVRPCYVDELEGGALQPVWKTARRTAMLRTPRSCTSLDNEDSVSPECLIYDSSQHTGGSHNGGIQNLKIQHCRKNGSYRRHSTLIKRLPKKMLKRTGLASQKTRRLSSIAVENSFGKDKSEFSYALKMPETPVVSCIPVKLVFSRIKEAVSISFKPVNHSMQT